MHKNRIMKKVININFQGRVIPIEETAYDMLTRYVESLRLFFANEEGKDEIINDIEGRIAELFGETLKKGSICITDADVNTIINSMGRPEDFEADEEKVHSKLGAESSSSYSYNQGRTTGRGRLYRDENHKVLGGVCSGIANYFAIDPIVIRILFIVFIGITFIPYLILWVAVPSSSSLQIGSQRKRLFRDTETKIIGGVCSGLAQYFNVQIWVPRVLFLIPFFSFVFRWGHWGWWDFPHFLSFSFSPGSIFVYIILWLILPEAKTTADKLEMKGEKVDLNNIKSTIQGDLEGFKDRAQQFGSELKDRAQSMGEELSSAGKKFGAEASAVGRRSGGGLGHVIKAIVKIFVYFFVGCILLAVVGSLFGLGVVLTGLLPAYSYVLDSRYQEILAWCSLIFFIWVPVIAIVTWIIRKLTGKKGNSGIIRLTFLSFWILGVICFVNLIISISSEFRYKNYPTEQSVALPNPNVNKLEIKTAAFGKYYSQNWLRLEPFASVDDDTVYVRNVRLRIIKAPSDSFQVFMVKMANGSSKDEAERTVSRINYNVVQRDSFLLLDKGLAITKGGKFRNQQVIVTVAVPVGKRIYINDNVGWGNDVRVNMGRDNDFWDWENNMESVSLRWRHDVEYIMTAKGLERVDNLKDDDDNNNNDENSNETIEQFRKSKEQMQREKEQKLRELQEIDRELQKSDSTLGDSTRYRYKPSTPATPQTKKPKRTDIASTEVTGLSDMLMIKFAL
jgi:phage shock protein PspC (stress-responsive transcriptional regulator)/heme/copper-type cytochrome/quinol oxidase subunit 2